jgi:hypothetical protein
MPSSSLMLGSNVGRVFDEWVSDEDPLDPLAVIEILSSDNRCVPGIGGGNDKGIPE